MLVAVVTTGTSLLTNAVNYVDRNRERSQNFKQIMGIVEGIRDSMGRMDRAALELEMKGEKLERDRKRLEIFERELERELVV